MAQIKTRALVIRERPFQDQDKILTLYTENEGKIQAIAKGVRRNKSPLVAATQLFTYAEFVYWPGKNFANINQAHLIESYYALRGNLVKMSLASYIVELLDAFYDFYQGTAEVLKLATYILYYIAENKTQNDEALVVALQLKLCFENGIWGAIGKQLTTADNVTYKLDELMQSDLQLLLKQPIRSIKTSKWDALRIQRLLDLMNHYITSNLSRRLQTYDFYKEIKH